MEINKETCIVLYRLFKQLREQDISKVNKIACTRNFISLMSINKEFENLNNEISNSFRAKFEAEITEVDKFEKEKQNEIIETLRRKENEFFTQDAGLVDFLQQTIEINLYQIELDESILCSKITSDEIAFLVGFQLL